MNYYETHLEVIRFKDGRAEPFRETYELERDAVERAEAWAASENLRVIRVPWNQLVKDVEKPPNCVVVEEVRVRNPYTKPQRVYNMV